MIDPEESKWFVISDGRVTGPFSKLEIDGKSAQIGGALIWGRGQGEWLPYQRWSGNLNNFEAAVEVQASNASRLWYLRIHGQELDPLRYDEMLEVLRKQSDISSILVWTEGYSEWREIHQIHKIMDEMGVSRRQHARVPINGILTCESSRGAFESRVLSISEGGLGISEAPLVKIGEKFRCVLKSPSLFNPVTASVEVIYSGGDGYAGLKFLGLTSESKTAILEFIKNTIDGVESSHKPQAASPEPQAAKPVVPAAQVPPVTAPPPPPAEEPVEYQTQSKTQIAVPKKESPNAAPPAEVQEYQPPDLNAEESGNTHTKIGTLQQTGTAIELKTSATTTSTATVSAEPPEEQVEQEAEQILDEEPVPEEFPTQEQHTVLNVVEPQTRSGVYETEPTRISTTQTQTRNASEDHGMDASRESIPLHQLQDDDDDVGELLLEDSEEAPPEEPPDGMMPEGNTQTKPHENKSVTGFTLTKVAPSKGDSGE